MFCLRLEAEEISLNSDKKRMADTAVSEDFIIISYRYDLPLIA